MSKRATTMNKKQLIGPSGHIVLAGEELTTLTGDRVNFVEIYIYNASLVILERKDGSQFAAYPSAVYCHIEYQEVIAA